MLYPAELQAPAPVRKQSGQAHILMVFPLFVNLIRCFRLSALTHGAEQFHLVPYDLLHGLNLIGNQPHHGGSARGQALLNTGFSGFVDIREDIDLAYASLHRCPEI